MPEKCFMQHNVENKELTKEKENEKREMRNGKPEMTNEKKQFKKITQLKKNQKDLIGLIKISLRRFQLLLTATNLGTEKKQVNSSMITLKT